jgi:CRISPR system Cascade subunit CasE
MIASTLKLNRSAYRAFKITDPYSIHRTVYSLFPKIENTERDFLFADKGGNFDERRILILSKRSPLQPEYGTVESKVIPESFLNCDTYGFEIRLNPTKREKNSGKIIPVQGTEKQDSYLKKKKLLEWFCAKSESWGFSTDHNSLQIQSTDVQIFEKGNKQIIQSSVTFIGKLRVKNRVLFIKSFEEGIGRGKAFGFGLLEIVPLQEQK